MKYKIKEIMKTDISKLYIMGVLFISLLMIGGFFSYAMFTVSKEKENAISIVTGNLVYKLEVDGVETTALTIEGGTSKTFTVTLSNPNNRTARFNFYYVGTLDSDLTVGYVVSEGVNIPPVAKGINLEKSGASGSSNTYIINVINNSNNSKTINLGVQVGLDYNDLTLPSDGHLFDEVELGDPVSDVVLANVGSNGSTYDDGEDTFITGVEPNNYIWYSGKLWRAVSVNNEEKTTKLVTQWNISAIPYNPSNQTAFEGSFMEDWLNDTSVDGFLGNLRDYENFIVTDAKWNATLTTSSSKPSETTMVEDAVGLLNYYEYVTSYKGTTSSNGYLNNGLYWWCLTPYDTSLVRSVNSNGNASYYGPSNASGVRPSLNLRSNARIVDGDGTIDNPYRLKGDNESNLTGTLLNTRFSGEYIRFGTGENNLYMIVSHETSGLTKITNTGPLKDSGTFKTSAFGSNTVFSSTNTIGTFLNGDYLTNYVGDTYSNMISDDTTWYLGTVGSGVSYKLAKYTDITSNTLTSSITTAKVGLLRLGELNSGQFERYAVGGSTSTGLTTTYWTLTPYSTSRVRSVDYDGLASYRSPSSAYGVRPSLNLKSNVIITSGDGTKENPFEIQLGS